jgi:hypothetical protein
MQTRSSWNAARIVLGGCFALALNISAQVQSQTSTASGTPTTQVMVERGTVVSVQGNDLFVEMSDGSVRHFPNVPESARVTVGNQQLGIHDLKPGMKLERTTVTTTTPQVVTTVQTVTGRVVNVTPPLSVILRLENGDIQQFRIPEGQRFMVDGRETDAWSLRRDMQVTATRITEAPVNRVAQNTNLTGKMPAMPANVPVLVELPRGGASSSVTANATITAIDKTNREVTLRSPQGNSFIVHAGDDVQRFNDLKVGDRVSATYFESIAWSVRRTGQSPLPSETQTLARREGGPGAAVASQKTSTVTVTAIDRATSSVTVKGPQGNILTFKVIDPKNLEDLKVGDRVDVSYTQGVLLRVDPVAG